MGTSTSFAEGTVVAERYRLLARLGNGAMGEVWKAEHLSLRSLFALKLIDPALLDIGAAREELFARFEREAQASAQLQSPHVVQVTDHGLDRGIPYIAMELLQGETLGARLERVGNISATETVKFMSHVARAMTRAHEAGIIHRDLKPDNIFIVRNEDDEIAKVLDFGIAKLTRSSLDIGLKATSTGQLLGTPCYMSPEQATGAPLDHRSDLWSMAVIAFECLTGSLPFLSTNLGDMILSICSRPLPIPSQVAPGLPPAFDAWWARAASRDVNARFPSARAMVDALRDALAGVESPRPELPAGPVSAVEVSPASLLDRGTVSPVTTHRTRAAREQKRRSKLVYGGIGGAVVLALAGGLLAFPSLWSNGDATSQPAASELAKEGSSEKRQGSGVTEAAPTVTLSTAPSVTPDLPLPATASATAAATATAAASLQQPARPVAAPVLPSSKPTAKPPPTSKPMGPTDPRLGL
jgi:serine/threonine-protein kinase